jgi:hypothetical protein
MRTADSIEETKAANSQDAESFGRDGKRKGKRGKSENSLRNLKPYIPGVSGNPSGKPGYDVAAVLARAVIEGCTPEAYKGLAKALSKGNAYVFKELAERGYGKLKEIQQVTHVYEEVKDADLNTRIADIERDLGLARAIDEAGRAASAHEGAGPTNGKAKVADVLS